ncbi:MULTISPECIES: AraC family transcriptional regulator [unclassified Bradyrhizobium]|uniref:AraC family transcriptional regulator n=1 Tax=unclassified Bradyrhizobium TaxID=2631580 RepID=UPI0024E0473E|nr:MULTISPECIES: AraC family transcriptional regulator [unclassified Bradyrhizobium]
MEISTQGVNGPDVLDGTGLDLAELDLHTTQVSYQQLDTVIRNAIHLSRDSAIALRAGLRMHVTRFGMYGYALLSSPSHREARAFSNRYIRVAGPLCDATSAYEQSTVVCTIEPRHWADTSDDAYRFAVEFALSAHLTTSRDLAGTSFGFSHVSLAYDKPEHAGLYDELFACPVLFGQRNNTYGYDLSSADGVVTLADPRSHAMAREMCEQVLAEVNRGGSAAAEIRRRLIERTGRYPNIEVIAEELAIHPRALRRRLEAEGTSYRDILADVRRRLAIEYLRKTDMTNEEIASRLGYSDAANFRHAFLRWTGKSPSDFRVSANTF